MSRLISDLILAAQKKCLAFLEKTNVVLAPQGYSIFLTETYRSQARQDLLYAQGRTAPGQIVTWAKISYHTSGKAWDCAFKRADGTVTWKGPWAQVGAIAKSLGITWGAEITHGKDKGHFQI